jgi:hypothetical protein
MGTTLLEHTRDHIPTVVHEIRSNLRRLQVVKLEVDQLCGITAHSPFLAIYNQQIILHSQISINNDHQLEQELPLRIKSGYSLVRVAVSYIY